MIADINQVEAFLSLSLSISDELILAIKSDIDIAKNKLSLDDIERQQLSSYFN